MSAACSIISRNPASVFPFARLSKIVLLAQIFLSLSLFSPLQLVLPLIIPKLFSWGHSYI